MQMVSRKDREIPRFWKTVERDEHTTVDTTREKGLSWRDSCSSNGVPSTIRIQFGSAGQLENESLSNLGDSRCERSFYEE